MRTTSFLVGICLIVAAYEVRPSYSSNGLSYPFRDLKETLFLSNCDPISERIKCISEQPFPFRSIDGTCNNLCRIKTGATEQPHARLKGLNPPTAFEPGFKPRMNSVLPNKKLPNARKVSVEVFSNTSANLNNTRPDFTHMQMTWGQFLDHDITLTPFVPGVDCGLNDAICPDRKGCVGIDIPPGLGLRKRQQIQCIPLFRSIQNSEGNQINRVTSYIDGSQIYGSDKELAETLRDPEDRRFLDVRPFEKSASGRACGLLPEAEEEAFCRSPNPVLKPCFLAGDERVNENQALMAMHTLWVREHNLIAKQLSEINPKWDAERVYQEARKIVGAELQHITYNEWLRRLFGDNLLKSEDLLLEPKGQYFKGYDPKTADGRIINSFATAVLRIGHTLIRDFFDLRTFSKTTRSSRILRAGRIPVKEFFNPALLLRGLKYNFIGAILLGLSQVDSQLLDPHFTNAVREDLILPEPPDSVLPTVGDLPAINTQRGRDHGLPSYGIFRQACGGQPVTSFESLLSTIPQVQVDRLKNVYESAQDVELWPGGISEFPIPESDMGFTFTCIMLKQFRKLRYGDRFWYERNDPISAFTLPQLAEIKKTTMSRVLCDNTDNVFYIQKNAFKQRTDRSGDNPLKDCDYFPRINFELFKEHEKTKEEGEALVR